MNDAHETLSKILQREAEKLDKLSAGDGTDRAPMLDGDSLERLEILSRCVKALRPPGPPPKKADGSDEEDVDELLGKARA